MVGSRRVGRLEDDKAGGREEWRAAGEGLTGLGLTIKWASRAGVYHILDYL